jgi:hypothetical protein
VTCESTRSDRSANKPTAVFGPSYGPRTSVFLEGKTCKAVPIAVRLDPGQQCIVASHDATNVVGRVSGSQSPTLFSAASKGRESEPLRSCPGYAFALGRWISVELPDRIVRPHRNGELELEAFVRE